MVQGTTPTFILTLPEDITTEEMSHVVFILSQNRVSIKKMDDELTMHDNVIEVCLTQEETLRFTADTPSELQLNWTYPDGKRACTCIQQVRVGRNLLKEVMPSD